VIPAKAAFAETFRHLESSEVVLLSSELSYWLSQSDSALHNGVASVDASLYYVEVSNASSKAINSTLEETPALMG
jgi:hypothetical protein